MQLITSEAAQPNQPLKESMFQSSGDFEFSEMGTEQGWQVLHTLLPLYLYAKNKVQVAEYIINLLGDRIVTVPLQDWERYLKWFNRHLRYLHPHD